jgi:helix-turn-helix protein
VEVDVLEEVRKRREVSLKTRGRNIASESINEK